MSSALAAVLPTLHSHAVFLALVVQALVIDWSIRYWGALHRGVAPSLLRLIHVASLVLFAISALAVVLGELRPVVEMLIGLQRLLTG